jgi:hypothetical protein
MTEMRMLSVQQPWAHLLVKGVKDVENRPWSTSYRGPLLIHAGQLLNSDVRECVRDQIELGNLDLRERLYFGGVIGRVDLAGVGKGLESKWAHRGLFHLVVNRGRKLPFVRRKGMLGLLHASWPMKVSSRRTAQAWSLTAAAIAAGERLGGTS